MIINFTLRWWLYTVYVYI